MEIYNITVQVCAILNIKLAIGVTFLNFASVGMFDLPLSWLTEKSPSYRNCREMMKESTCWKPSISGVRLLNENETLYLLNFNSIHFTMIDNLVLQLMLISLVGLVVY